LLVKGSRLNRRDPAAALDDCPPPDGACHGLAGVTARPLGEDDMILTAPTEITTSDAVLNGALASRSIVRYRFQISRDGRHWSNVGPASYASSTAPLWVSANASELQPAQLYMARLVLYVRSGLGEERAVASSERAFVTAPAEEAPVPPRPPRS
jgi:hypothetical protein